MQAHRPAGGEARSGGGGGGGSRGSRRCWNSPPRHQSWVQNPLCLTPGRLAAWRWSPPAACTRCTWFAANMGVSIRGVSRRLHLPWSLQPACTPPLPFPHPLCLCLRGSHTPPPPPLLFPGSEPNQDLSSISVTYIGVNTAASKTASSAAPPPPPPGRPTSWQQAGRRPGCQSCHGHPQAAGRHWRRFKA